MTTNKIIVYHSSCHDGISSLWAALQSKEWAGAEYIPGVHGTPPDLERLRGKEVLCVDFCFEQRPDEGRSWLTDVLAVAEHVTVIDHHASVLEDVSSLPRLEFQYKTETSVRTIQAPNFEFYYNANRSGATFTWDRLIGGKRPRLLDYVEDRDVWRLELPRTREVHAACQSYPLDLGTRAKLIERTERPGGLAALADEGTHVLRYHNQLLDTASKLARFVIVAGHRVPVVETSNIELATELAHHLANKYNTPFAIAYSTLTDGKRRLSFRRRDGSDIDLTEIARQFGGGGHKGAAGAVIPSVRARLDEERQRLQREYERALSGTFGEVASGSYRNGVAAMAAAAMTLEEEL